MILGTNLTRHMEPEQLAALRDAAAAGEFGMFQGAPFRFKSVAQGAATSVLVATSPQLEGIGGRYFEDNNEGERLSAEAVGKSPGGVAPYAVDPDAAERLWELSLAAIGA